MKCYTLSLSVLSVSLFCVSPASSLEVVGGSNYKDEASIIYILDKEREISDEYPCIECLTETQKTDLKQKIDFHKKQGDLKFREAEKICLCWPYDDRQAAQKLFRDAILISVTNKNFPALMRTLIVSLADYGYSVYSEFVRMESLLREAEYHYEMHGFYTKTLYGYSAEFEGLIGEGDLSSPWPSM